MLETVVTVKTRFDPMLEIDPMLHIFIYTAYFTGTAILQGG
ncbi:MAG: hypothetical protein ACLFNV_07155 [Desulfovibrionales bacterium]